MDNNIKRAIRKLPKQIKRLNKFIDELLTDESDDIRTKKVDFDSAAEILGSFYKDNRGSDSLRDNLKELISQENSILLLPHTLPDTETDEDHISTYLKSQKIIYDYIEENAGNPEKETQLAALEGFLRRSAQAARDHDNKHDYYCAAGHLQYLHYRKANPIARSE